ncbi:hypothetical protein G6011_10524 [Alternaria panax]|uniref:Uncharacterized protein n=1 Tax=Alternaria panax TaxID=48097 RepID=A0AAD4IBZ4_9PLEO|nr:hypothetical protein G6011_10524 [Alternaria panax]
MSTVFDKVNEGDTWSLETTAGQKPSFEGPKNKKKKDYIQATKDHSKSPNTGASDGDGTDKVDKGKASDVPKEADISILSEWTKARVDTVVPDMKHKSAAEDDVDRMKNMKIDEDERVFVGEKTKKKDSPTQEEKETPTEPAVLVPIKLKLPPTKK